MSALDIQLSGTVEVVRDGTVLELPGRRVRSLLALLALSCGETVPIERLATGLWDEDPPERVRGSLQTYVGRLRQVLGAGFVTTQPVGYRLQLPRPAVDLLDFAERVEQARSCLDPRIEREQLREATLRWRGPPFGELASSWLARFEVPLWVERHLQVVERLADLDLAAGDSATSAVELQELVSHHPLRETLWARWLAALHACGRTAEALAQYDLLRARLADELGVDPSAQLRALHRDLLQGEPSTGSRAGPPSTSGPRSSPMSIPVGIAGFIGRSAELAALDGALGRADHDAPLLVAVHGPAGSGKTSLAVHWSHRVQSRFPDGQLLVNLHGFGPGDPMTEGEALRILLRSLGVQGSQLPTASDERVALWRSLMADKRLLVVLDNARESAQVRPLLPGGASVVLVTSRSQLRSLATREGAHRLTLEAMPKDEAVNLLATRLGTRAAPGEELPQAAQLAQLAALCDGLPLALAVAAERASRAPDPSLDGLVAQLRDDRQRLHRLTAWEDDPLTSVQAVFDWSYRTLDAPSARILRFLGLATDSRVTAPVAAALAGRQVRGAEQSLDRLADCHLVREAEPGWYELHDLTRAYAIHLLERHESDAERRDAVRRLRSWYLHTAASARAAVSTPHPIVELGEPDAEVCPETFPDSAAAFAWFLGHRRGLTTMVADAAESGDHGTAHTVISVLALFLGIGGGLAEEVRLFLLAESSARAAGDELAQAVCASHLGMTYGRTQQYARAKDWFATARRRFADVPHRAGELHMAMALGMVETLSGHPDRGAVLLEDTLAAATAAGLPGRAAVTLNNLAFAYLQLGRYTEAAGAAEASATRHADMRNPLSEAMALDTLGTVHLHRQDPPIAHAVLTRAVDLHRSLGESLSHATALKNLGLAELGLGRPDAARRMWKESLRMLEWIDAADSQDLSRAELRSLLGIDDS